MAYQSLYRRYRPRRFGEVLGQDHVVRSLRNGARDDRVGHAYLFSGPRGTGKTSTARILAKVLNCQRPLDGEPCCECDSCVAVEAGTSYDVHELDAASNNGVDAMRDLIDKAALGTPGRTKVYILDEVHMLSKAAEAALLKTLEEPPAHVVFVLATTDPQRISSTIKSRTQHYEFHLLAPAVLADHVRFVVADADLQIDAETIEAVVRLGAGSARDTLSALDQAAASGGLIEAEEPIDEIIEALAGRDTGRALAALAAATASGRDARTLADHLVASLRDGFLSLMAPQLVALPAAAAARSADQAKRLGAAALVRAMEVVGETLVEFRHAPDPRLLLDVALVKLTLPDADTSTAALLQRIERLERLEQAQVVAVAPSPVAPPAPTRPSGGSGSHRAILGGARERSTAPPPPAVGVAPSPTTLPSEPAEAPGLPDINELQRAWPERVLPRLRPRVKALYGGAHVVADEAGVAVLALPNAAHRDRCEPHRTDVEEALAAHFGRRVPVRLVVDTAAGSAPVRDRSEPPPAEDEVDPTELVDARSADALDPLARLTAAFPGAELVDEAAGGVSAAPDRGARR